MDALVLEGEPRAHQAHAPAPVGHEAVRVQTESGVKFKESPHFLSGVAYANNGQIKRVANSTFIITPYNVDIMGDLLDELENNGAFY